MKRGHFLVILFYLLAAPLFAENDYSTFSIGKSVQGRPLIAHRFGSGPVALVISGGIHGSLEGNTVALAERIVDVLADRNEAVPLTVYVVENLNPDATARTRVGESDPDRLIRFNANSVDLNRNWETADWQPNPDYHEGVPYPLAGGKRPMSEPETRFYARFLLRMLDRHPALLVVNLHSFVFQAGDSGAVLPSYTRDGDKTVVNTAAARFAHAYAEAAGYDFSQDWTAYEVPGEFLQWAGDRSIAALDIELADQGSIDEEPAGRQSHLESTLRGMDRIIRELSVISQVVWRKP